MKPFIAPWHARSRTLAPNPMTPTELAAGTDAP